MTALRTAVIVDGTVYPAGTDHTAMPAKVVDEIRSGTAWVGGVAPAPSVAPAGKGRLNPEDLANSSRLRAALGLEQTSGGVLNVRDYGAKADGVADDTAALNTALAAAVPGSTVVFPAPPAGGYYKISDRLLVPAKVTVQGGGRGCEIRQSSWAKPVFELFNVDGCTIRGFSLVFSGTRPTALTGVIFRGEDSYGYSSGVWTNGNNHLIQDLRISGFGNGVRLVHWTSGTNSYSGYRTGNKVLNVEAVGIDFGLLAQGQDSLFIDDLYSYDHVDSSGGLNPLHTIYVTGSSTLRSRNIVIGKAHGDNVSGGIGGGYAHQFKYVDGLTFGTLSSNNTTGPWNSIDCTDVTGAVIAGKNCTTSGNGGAVAFQTVAANHARVNISSIAVHMSSSDERAFYVQADDAYFGEVVLSTNRNGTGTYATFYDATITGNRLKVGALRIRNRGTSQVRPVLVGHPSHPTSDVTISGLSCDNTLSLVEFSATATGTNVVEYNPADQRRVTSPVFTQAHGSAVNYTVTRLGGGNRDTPTVGEIVPERDKITTGTVSPLSGGIYLNYFTAERSEAITTLTAFTGATAAGATPTLCRMCVYSVADNGDLTLVASTPNDTTLFSTINTAYPKALSATWNKLSGQRYAVGLIIISAATMPTFHGLQMTATNPMTALTRVGPPTTGRLLGQTDLVSPITAGSLAGWQAKIAIQMS